MAELYNSVRLFKFIARKERVISLVWVLSLVGFVLVLIPGMYHAIDEYGRNAMLPILSDPTMVALVGPGFGIDEGLYGFGAWFAHMMYLFTSIAVAIMSIFLAVRHTRRDEEHWRYEVLRSLPIGRLSNINATALMVLCVNIAISLLIGLGAFALGDSSMGFGASLLFGLGHGAVGLVFGAIAALFAQLSSTTRGALSYSFLALGLFYMLRAVGDMNLEILSLINPLGLPMRSQFFVHNYVWPQIIMLAAAVIIFAIAYKLNTMRDIDQGFIPIKPGRREAKKSLLSPLGLCLRLTRTSIISWVIIMFVIGASYGAIMGDIGGFIEGNEFYQQLLGLGGMTAAEIEAFGIINFASTITLMMTMINIVPIILVSQRLKGEEKEGRVELVLSCPVSKGRLFLNYVMVAAALSVLLQLALAAGLYASAVSMLEHNPLDFMGLTRGALAYLPAMWVFVGLSSVLLAFGKKFASLVWLYFLFVFLVFFLGVMELFPAAISGLSVFYQTPMLPLEDVSALPLVIMGVVAVTLVMAAAALYKSRDIRNI